MHRALEFTFVFLLVFVMIGAANAMGDGPKESDQVHSSPNFPKKTISSQPNTSMLCGNSQKTALRLERRSNIRFLIPESYLYDPYRVYYRPSVNKESISLISIMLSKSDGGPNCNQAQKSKLYTNVSIQPASKAGFKLSQENVKNGHVYDLGIEDNTFHVYRSTPTILKMTSDFLVPISTPYQETIYFKCSYGLAIDTTLPDKEKRRVNCHAYSLLSDEFRIEYFVLPNELKNYKNIDQTIKRAVKNFMS